MRVLFSHFFNEEYLLPWWLTHHSPIFDHGVLINYGSTDRSLEIIRSLVPTWEVIDSKNSSFEALMCDQEIMSHEARFPDAWKITLNTTEFLVGQPLEKLETFIEQQDSVVGVLPGVIMADISPEHAPRADVSLISQKTHGIWESEFVALNLKIRAHRTRSRSRIYHRYKIGAYYPGRHRSHLPRQIEVPEDVASLWWYGYSPWTAEFKKRKRQIEARVPSFDKSNKFGEQHSFSINELDDRRQKFCSIGYDVRGTAPKKAKLRKLRLRLLRKCVSYLERT